MKNLMLVLLTIALFSCTTHERYDKERSDISSLLCSNSSNLNVEPTANGIKPKYRTIYEIKDVFDQNKGIIYSAYSQRLKSNAALEGKVVFEMRVSSEGIVRSICVVKSDIRDDLLLKNVMKVIEKFRFSKGDFTEMTIEFPIDSLPS